MQSYQIYDDQKTSICPSYFCAVPYPLKSRLCPNFFDTMGINDRDYMRRRDSEPVTTPHKTVIQGVILGLCIVIGALVIGNKIRRNLADRQPDVEVIDMKKLESRLLPPTEPPNSVKRPVDIDTATTDMKELKSKLQPLTEPPNSIKRKVDINSATADELDTLPYVGETTAKSIMTHRPYQTIEDLKKVPGITQRRFDEIRPYVMVGDPE
jgi:competence ComEA-like helix-hairpin-helix protein